MNSKTRNVNKKSIRQNNTDNISQTESYESRRWLPLERPPRPTINNVDTTNDNKIILYLMLLISTWKYERCASGQFPDQGFPEFASRLSRIPREAAREMQRGATIIVIMMIMMMMIMIVILIVILIVICIVK